MNRTKKLKNKQTGRKTRHTKKLKKAQKPKSQKNSKMAKMPQMPKMPKRLRRLPRLSRIPRKPKLPRLQKFPRLPRLKHWVFSKGSSLGLFCGKVDGFFKKSLNFFFKIAKRGKFAVECVSNGFKHFSNMSSELFMMFFGKKHEGTYEETWNLGTLEKLETMMKKDCFSEKKKFFSEAFITKMRKRSLVFSRHILKNVKAKSSTQLGHFRRFFTRCLPIAFTLKRCAFAFLNVNFSSDYIEEHLL